MSGVERQIPTCCYEHGLSGVRRKFSWGRFHSVAYGGHFYLMCVVCDVKIWRHMFTNVLATFVNIISIFFYTHSPYFMCHCTEYKLSALHVGISEENKLNATTQEFITAKMSGCALKQGSKTLSLRQSNLQLQNEAALMSCRIREVIMKSVRLDWLEHTPVWKMESYYEAHNKLSIFCYVYKSSKLLVFLLRHHQMSECFYVENCCFWACAMLQKQTYWGV